MVEVDEEAKTEENSQQNSVVWFSASSSSDIDECISTIAKVPSMCDLRSSTKCIIFISRPLQALQYDPVSQYFTRRNHQVSILFWEEILRATVRTNKEAQQFCCLSDFSASAVVVEYPRDSISPWTLLLRLMSIIPLAKWRALGEYLNNIERQKSAFFKAHGSSFLYVLLLADQTFSHGMKDVDDNDDTRATAVMKSLCGFADAAQRTLYIEARGNQRGWLKTRYGFADVMSYRVRAQNAEAPVLYILARRAQSTSDMHGGSSRASRQG